MKTGTTGYAERSRVQGAAMRVPTVVYERSKGPGMGALVVPDEVDPTTQAEKYVARVAGPSELQWAHGRMQRYAVTRDARLKVATFRHDLLRRAVAEMLTNGDAAAVAAAARCADPAILGGVSNNEDAAPSDEFGRAREYFAAMASPEELTAALVTGAGEAVVRAIEGQVLELKQALQQDFTAQAVNRN